MTSQSTVRKAKVRKEREDNSFHRLINDAHDYPYDAPNARAREVADRIQQALNKPKRVRKVIGSSPELDAALDVC